MSILSYHHNFQLDLFTQHRCPLDGLSIANLYILDFVVSDASFHGHNSSPTPLQAMNTTLDDVGHKPTMTLKQNFDVVLILDDVVVLLELLCNLSP
jgi:hypothetical protein